MSDTSYSYTAAHTQLKRISAVLCWIIALLGFAAIGGWTFDIDVLKTFSIKSVPTNPLTALCLIGLGVSLYLKSDRYGSRFINTAQNIAVVTLATGLLKLSTFLLPLNIPLDTLLFSGRLTDPINGLKNTMPFMASVCLIFSSLSIIFLDYETKTRTRPAQFLAIFNTLISLLVLYGYIYDVKYLHGQSFISMGLNTALAYLLLGLAILFSRPNKGSMAVIISDHTTEVVLLRFLSLFLPLILGWLKLRAVKTGIISNELATAIFALFTYALAMFLIGRKSLVQYRLKRLKETAERIIKEDAEKLNAILDNSNAAITIRNRTGQFLNINKQYADIFNISKDAAETFQPSADTTNEENLIYETGRSVHKEETVKVGDKTLSFITVKFPLADSRGRIKSICSISTDITKLKEYELELIEKEKRLWAVLNNIGEGVVVADSDGSYIIFNKLAEEMLGVGTAYARPEEWTEKYNIFFPDGKTPFPADKLPLMQALNGFSVDEEEVLICNANSGCGKRLSITGRPIVKEDQTTAGVIVCRDVTEYRKLQEEIQNQLLLMEGILDNSGDGVVVADSDDSFLVYNSTAEEITGVERFTAIREEWPRKFFACYLDGKTLYSYDQFPLTLALQGYSTDDEELLICNPQFNKFRRVSMTARPVVKADHSMAAVIVFRDVTEKRELQLDLHSQIMMLEEQQHFISRISETSPFIIYVFELQTLRFFYSSRDLLKDLGYGSEFSDMTSQEVFRGIIHPDDLEQTIKTITDLTTSEDREIRAIEHRLKNAEGNYQWYLSNYSVFRRDADNKVSEIVGITININEKKEAEKKLNETLYLINKVAETSPDNIFVHDLIENRNIYSNNALSEALGYSRQELQNLGDRLIGELLHPDDLKTYNNSIIKVKQIKDDESIHDYYRMKGADGKWHWFFGRFKVFRRDNEGKVSQFIGVSIDVTPSIETFEQLKEKNIYIEKISNTTPDIIYVLDLSANTLVYANRNIQSIGTNIPTSENPVPFDGLVNQEDIAKVRKHHEKFYSGDFNSALEITFRFRTSDKKWKWFSSREVPFLKDANGKTIQVIGIASDMDERIRLEEHLKQLNEQLEEKVKERTERVKQKERQLNLIIDAIPVYIAYVNCNEVIEFANTNFNRLHHDKPVTGRKLQDFADQDLYGIINTNLRKALSGQRIQEISKVSATDNSTRMLQFHYIPDLDKNQHIRGVVVMAVDLTEQLNYEKLLEAKNTDLLTINKEMDTFVYTASHDLKSPVANVEGLLDFLHHMIQTSPESETEKTFDMIELSVKNLKTTIEDLADIARIQKGISEAEWLDIIEFYNEFIQTYRKEISDNQIVFKTDFKCTSLKFSRKNFRSIITNLLSNAVKYRSRDRQPVIEIKTSVNDKNQFVLIVSDNGLGIDPEDKEKVFELFRRLHTDIPGTGVGLYIVKKILDNSGGKIELQTRAGKGSVFTIIIDTETR
jgi:PAS domain S-box-containing protein